MIRIRLMNADDVPLGMRLKSQAGWNQVEADWRRFLEMQPDGCFVAELDGDPVGTTVTCIFGGVAWIAMVLVDENARGQGVGTALLQHAVAFLDLERVPSVWLDATPLGQPIYEKLGFTGEYALARYEGVLPGATNSAKLESEGGIKTAATEDFGRIIELDREVTGIDRSKFLARLLRERPDSVRLVEGAGRPAGYLAVRPGSNALQLGPCMGTPEAGAALIADAAVRFAGQRVYLDIPQQNEVVIGFADQLGLNVQRTFVRMCRGPRVSADITRLVASSGPELG